MFRQRLRVSNPFREAMFHDTEHTEDAHGELNRNYGAMKKKFRGYKKSTKRKSDARVRFIVLVFPNSKFRY